MKSFVKKIIKLQTAEKCFADKTLNEITDNLYKFMRSLPFPKRWIAEVHKNFTDDKIFDSFIKDNICVAQTKAERSIFNV